MHKIVCSSHQRCDSDHNNKWFDCGGEHQYHSGRDNSGNKQREEQLYTEYWRREEYRKVY